MPTTYLKFNIEDFKTLVMNTEQWENVDSCSIQNWICYAEPNSLIGRQRVVNYDDISSSARTPLEIVETEENGNVRYHWTPIMVDHPLDVFEEKPHPTIEEEAEYTLDFDGYVWNLYIDNEWVANDWDTLKQALNYLKKEIYKCRFNNVKIKIRNIPV